MIVYDFYVGGGSFILSAIRILIKLLIVLKVITVVSWFPYYYVIGTVGLTQHVFLALCSWICMKLYTYIMRSSVYFKFNIV